MPFINPYISKTENHPNILVDSQQLSQFRGKWQEKLGGFPVFLEIGIGMGRLFRHEVEKYPDRSFVGIELRYKRLWNTAERLEHIRPQQWLVTRARGEDITEFFAPGELSGAYVFFPDPWPRKRQQKNRLVQAEFLKNLATCMKPGGILWFKTDHPDYFQSVVGTALPQSPEWKIRTISHDTHTDPALSALFPLTEFELMTIHGEGAKIGFLELERI